MNPVQLEELAWLFANAVRQKGVLFDYEVELWCARLVPRPRDSRAVLAFVVLKGWSESFDAGWGFAVSYGVGQSFWKELRRRTEAVHGIGAGIREDWERQR